MLFPLRIDGSVFDLSLSWAKELTDSRKKTGRLVADFEGWKDPSGE